MWEVEDAREHILARAMPLESERVFLTAARGRVLAEEIFAPINVPPFTNSAVDGYAVIALDVEKATPADPIVLSILGEVMAGDVPTISVEPGTAIRVMTGAPMPDGANAMIMVEDTELREHDIVAILEAARSGQYVRRIGGDVTVGQSVVGKGTILNAAELGVLASLGISELSVYRKPTVAVITTGDEVVDIHSAKTLPPGKIWDSNRLTLAALVEEAGGVVHSMIHIPDDYEATKKAFQRLSDGEERIDILVTAGGVSVGDRDYVKPVLEELGELELWRVAMRPGKPLAFGRIGKSLFFGLPGNPVSTMVTFELFVRPVLQKMQGKPNWDRPVVQATLTEPIAHELGRREYVRAITTLENGRWHATTTGAQASNRLMSMCGANSLLVLPADTSDYIAGSVVDCLLLI